MFTFKLSSGLFALPANAKSVDWAVVNDSPIIQVVRVSVYRCGVGAAKTLSPPGPISETLSPNFVFHNANSVGYEKPFTPGFYYEVVVETNDRRVLPSVMIWQDTQATAIPGTLITAGDFVNVN
jgi:hypothetical protein